MRFVLDTNVIVAGLRSPTGASAALLDRALSGSFVLVLSVALALVLARTPRHPEAPGNPLLDTDDLESLHQLLLFPGQRTQHGLQLGEQRTLDRLPIGGEGTTQAVHGLFD